MIDRPKASRLCLVLGALLCVAGGTFVSPHARAAAPQRVQFTANATESSLSLSCNQTTQWCTRKVRGVGTASYHGQTMSMVEMVNDRFNMAAPWRHLDYTLTMTLGTGDTLAIQSRGIARDDPTGAALVDQAFVWVVTSGTGRFHGAKGSGVAYDWLNRGVTLPLKGPPVFHGEVTFIGTLLLPSA